ncbi:MAG: nickel pincer cofactor biosynthesis protein LarC [Methanoregula sp.]|nr:nickel pincer cofactor biosynthesis protein LarC [Methanoregula sp.]
MRILVFDPFHGAAGDMITGSLLDCGADRVTVLRAMAAVVAEPSIATVSRAGIRAVKIDTRATPAHRTLAEVKERLRDAAPAVPEEALAMAGRVFDRINGAEEEVHGARLHFHEIGADDAIADIIGACTALHTLHVDGVVVLPIALGHGTATGSHGIFPIPAPLTAAILRHSGLEARPGDGVGELCTPTGAALLSEFSTLAAKELRTYRIISTGFGAGTRDPAHAPNVLRAIVVETVEGDPGTGGLLRDCVDFLETNVDDVSGEVIAHAIARFMNAGARDASAIPIVMKKGRPGFLIRVICTADCSTKMAELMARELGTLGIRSIPAVHRFIAERTMEQVGVTIGGEARIVPVKCGRMKGEIYMVKAEFEDARAWAEELGVPVRQVIQTIEETARALLVKR